MFAALIKAFSRSSVTDRSIPMAYTREHAAIAVLSLLAFAGSIARAQLNADQKSVLLTTHNERRSSVDASNMLQLVSLLCKLEPIRLSIFVITHSGMELSTGCQSTGRSKRMQSNFKYYSRQSEYSLWLDMDRCQPATKRRCN